ncbi:MAG: glutathione S-transferase family protein [Opitutales bacterium]|nr:glutathione S-transferase family protein [Opitutales bacterium]
MAAAKGQFPGEAGEDGNFERQEDAFRELITSDGSTPYAPARGRYHLYVSLACPWAHRALIVRKLKGLEVVVSASVVDPVRDERGWAFREGPGHGPDPVNGFAFLREAYTASDPAFSGRVTVPALWDRGTRRLVNNSEDDICRLFNGVLAPLGEGGPDLFPPDIAGEQEALSQEIYENVNNGVYRAGFATTQSAYERAVRTLFDTLDRLEERLGDRRYLFGERIVETDWRLFCTLVRFDAVYHGHFKCNLRRIVDYPQLQRYLRQLYHLPGIAEDVNFDHIKRHYYVTHEEINPTGIVPLGPVLDLSP